MSHVATVDLHVKDLDCLKRAAKSLGLRFNENKSTYKWYGQHVGDYQLPEGYSEADLGKCAHTLSIPTSDIAYEVGIAPKKKGIGYDLLWDFWQGGYGLESKIGKNGNKLKQEYAAEVAIKALRQQGFRPIREESNGRILITGEKI